MLHWLGVKPSYSRPRVSDDNAFSESLFRTAKCRPEFPAKGFFDLEGARAWATHFVRWYNGDHANLEARHAFYMQARERIPARWWRGTRDWTPIGPVALNPERDVVAAKARPVKEIQPLAA